MLVSVGSVEIRSNWYKPQLWSSPARTDDHRLTFFRSLGRWCFGCFNLRRDGQCDSNVDLVLSYFDNLIQWCLTLRQPELQSIQISHLVDPGFPEWNPALFP